MSKLIKFTDVNPFNKIIQKSINKSILKTVKDKDFILGRNVEKFENKFAKFVKVKHCISTNNGTDALILAMKSLGVKKDRQKKQV